MKLKKYSRDIFGSLLIVFSCFTAVIHSQTMEEIGKAAEWQINLPWSWQFNHCSCRWGYGNCKEEIFLGNRSWYRGSIKKPSPSSKSKAVASIGLDGLDEVGLFGRYGP